jgi:carboxyl-terminal processing protease
LKDAEKQPYEGFPAVGFSFFPTRDPQLRAYAHETGKPAGVYVTRVEPNMPAAKAGLQVGDRIVAIDGWPVQRRQLWSLLYLRRYLQPEPVVTLTLDRGDGVPVDARVPVLAVEGRQYYDLSRRNSVDDWYQLIRERESADSGWDSRFARPAPNVQYWRLRTFAVSPDHVRDGLRRARGAETLILALRGNQGGLVTTLTTLLARVAHADQVGDTLYVAQWHDRREAQLVERASEGERWHGKLIVLIDAGSLSASEAFADAVQRFGLGTLLGDRTPGFLTEAMGYAHLTAEATSVFYGTNIGVAMLERPDGSRVEGIGVTPDELIEPTADDLAQRRDPVLARALQIAGLPYDPVKAMDYYRFGEDLRDR